MWDVRHRHSGVVRRDDGIRCRSANRCSLSAESVQFAGRAPLANTTVPPRLSLGGAGAAQALGPGRRRDVVSVDPGLVEVDEQHCWTLLASRQIGRLGVNADLFPLIFVVNYGLDEATIVIRTHEGTKLSNCHQTRVSFEVDDIDYPNRSGWSVLVRAIADTVTGSDLAQLIERTRAHPVQPWAPGQHGHWLRLTPLMITGRRLVPGHLPPPFPDPASP